MCGIAGWFEYSRDREIPEAALRAMAEAIVHRGPDDEGIFLEPRRRLGFAFRRLSIVDLALGHQPMATPDKDFWIVFNGEIYNHLTIRGELEDLGHTFETRCDTEVILHAYRRWGSACVERLQGMFAIAIWNVRERELFLARDRVGIKPLYFSNVDGAFIFGSEIKSLFRHPSLAPRLNRDEMARYLTFLCVPPPNTLFEGVHKLRAGHTLTVTEKGIGEQERYWSPLPGPARRAEAARASEEDLAQELRGLLETSVRDRLMSDVPFGAFLSGGVDSSAIVSIMSRLLDRPVETFSVGYRDDAAFNEFENARRTAKLFGTNHHEVEIDHHDFRSFLPKLVHHQDEPIADPVCVPLYYVADLARRNGVIVTLVGEGADELFFGYTFHNRIRRMVERFWNPMQRVPGPLRGLATGLASPFVDPQRRDFLRRLREGGEPFWGGAVTFYPEELRTLAPGLAGDPRREEIIRALYAEIDTAIPDADFPARAGYLELMYRLPELLLMRVDKMTMAASVEGRVPFLDHRIVEYAFRIPGAHKVRDNVPKSILKRAVKDLLPGEIVHRPKVGFHVPVTRWFEQVLGPMADEILGDPRIEQLELWDPAEVKRLLAAQRAGKGNFGMRIWALVNFALWYRHWMLGEDL